MDKDEKEKTGKNPVKKFYQLLYRIFTESSAAGSFSSQDF